MNIIVTIDNEHMNSLMTVSRSLKQSGMSVDNVLSNIGIIAGSVDTDRAFGVLRQVEGVISVEEEREFTIPPPESDLQ